MTAVTPRRTRTRPAQESQPGSTQRMWWETLDPQRRHPFAAPMTVRELIGVVKALETTHDVFTCRFCGAPPSAGCDCPSWPTSEPNP